MRKKSLSSIVLMSSFLLLFSGCVSEKKPKEQDKTTSTLVKETLQSTTTTEMLVTTIKTRATTTTSANTSVSAETKSGSIRSTCLAETGEKNLDACMAAYAVQENDSEICSEISSGKYRDICYSRLGKKTKNAAYCDKVSDRDEKSMCLSVAQQDPSRCDEVTSERFREDCRIDSVTFKKDTSICEVKGSVNYQVYCLTKYAKVYNDYSACDSIEDSVMKDDCYMVTAKENNNVEACLKVFIQSSEICVIDVATALKDRSICEKIKDKETYSWCLASLEKDIHLCDRIEAGSTQDYCITYVAKALKDASICNKIEGNAACYTDLAGETGDLSLCSKIESPSLEYICYAFAKKSQAKMCSKIRSRTSADWYKDLSISCDRMAKDENTAEGIEACREEADKYKDPEMGEKRMNEAIIECYEMIIYRVEY
jgi:hypothetical protein